MKGLGKEGCNGLLITAGADGNIRISMIGNKKLAGPTILSAMRENPMLRSFSDFVVNGPSVQSEMVVTDNQAADQALPSEDEAMTVHTPGVSFVSQEGGEQLAQEPGMLTDYVPQTGDPQSGLPDEAVPAISEEESQAIEAEMTNT